VEKIIAAARVRPRPAIIKLLSALALIAGSSGCAGLEQLLGSGLITPPEINFLGAELVQAPSQTDLSAYYCPRVLKEKAGLGFTADLLCTRFFGKAPAESQMQVGFDLSFDVKNPNKIPLPLSEILTGLAIFPGSTNQNLGAVCLRLCAPGDSQCFGGSDQRGCQEAPGDLKSLNDFPQAVGNLLVARGVAALGGQPSGFVAPKVIAESSLKVVARMALTPEGLLPSLAELARQSVNELKGGKPASFQIPYKMEGTIFASGGSVGRVAAGFGPVNGAWQLPAERLLP
jgi:hypothetical protein